MSLGGWIETGILVLLMVYLQIVWNRHSASTLNIPERRTLYDFFDTHPGAVYALWFAGGLAFDLLRKYGI